MQGRYETSRTTHLRVNGVENGKMSYSHPSHHTALQCITHSGGVAGLGNARLSLDPRSC
jgi:hypothetical protein